jgi:hypothetical protein
MRVCRRPPAPRSCPGACPFAHSHSAPRTGRGHQAEPGRDGRLPAGLGQAEGGDVAEAHRWADHRARAGASVAHGSSRPGWCCRRNNRQLFKIPFFRNGRRHLAAACLKSPRPIKSAGPSNRSSARIFTVPRLPDFGGAKRGASAGRCRAAPGNAGPRSRSSLAHRASPGNGPRQFNRDWGSRGRGSKCRRPDW